MSQNATLFQFYFINDHSDFLTKYPNRLLLMMLTLSWKFWNDLVDGCDNSLSVPEQRND